jgi:hypothetical protein
MLSQEQRHENDFPIWKTEVFTVRIRHHGHSDAAQGLWCPSDTATDDTAPLKAEKKQRRGDGETIKVGILHSLSGTMAISETTVVDAESWPLKKLTPLAVFSASRSKR